jgi:hypothetical protein
MAGASVAVAQTNVGQPAQLYQQPNPMTTTTSTTETITGQPQPGPADYGYPPPMPMPGMMQPGVVPVPPNAVWIPGHYNWDPRGQNYVWLEGEYAQPPHPGAQWIAGHWQQTPTAWTWIDGRWQ